MSEAVALARSVGDERRINKQYRKHSMAFLQQTFDRISVVAIKAVLEQHHYSFPESYHVLAELTNHYDDLPHVLEVAPYLEDVNPTFLKHPRQKPKRRVPNSQLNEMLRQELEGIEELNKKKKAVEEEEKEEIGSEDEDEEGDDNTSGSKEDAPKPYECGCCYDDFYFEDMVQCGGEHLFCKGCLRKHVQETVFGNGAYHIQCMMSMGGNCTQGFSDPMLEKAFPDPTEKQKLDDYIMLAIVEKTNMDDARYERRLRLSFLLLCFGDSRPTFSLTKHLLCVSFLYSSQ